MSTNQLPSALVLRSSPPVTAFPEICHCSPQDVSYLTLSRSLPAQTQGQKERVKTDRIPQLVYFHWRLPGDSSMDGEKAERAESDEDESDDEDDKAGKSAEEEKAQEEDKIAT